MAPPFTYLSQHGAQELPGEGGFALGYGLRGAGGDDLAARAAAFGA